MAVIRRAEPADADGIATVHVETWRAAYAGIVPDEHLAGLSVEARAQRWREALLDTGRPGFAFVAQDDDGTIVGFASGGPERNGHPVYKGELMAIYILAGHQRRGIGRRLVGAVVGELLRQGFSSMLTWALTDNPSRAFYEALGGRLIDEQSIEIGGADLAEVAYGWADIRPLAGLGAEA